MVTANYETSASQTVNLVSPTTDIGAGTVTRDDTYEKFYFTSISAVALVSIVGNLIVIVVMLRTKRLRAPTNYFMISLSFSDLMQAVTYPFIQLRTHSVICADQSIRWVYNNSFLCPAQGKRTLGLKIPGVPIYYINVTRETR